MMLSHLTSRFILRTEEFISTRCNQHLHHLMISLISCNKNGCSPIIHRSIDASTSCSQHLHHLMISILSCNIKGCCSVIVSSILVSTRCDQKLNQLKVPSCCRSME